MELLKLVPESPVRDGRELELRQSVIQMLFPTKGQSVPETIQAIDYAEALARKSGNPSQLVDLMIERGRPALIVGDLLAAARIFDQALEVAEKHQLAESVADCRCVLGHAHSLVVQRTALR